MKKHFLTCLYLLFIFSVQAQIKVSAIKKEPVQQPTLVVGIVIDQMRWDYLYRFQPLFSEKGGFARFFQQGFLCNNTFIPYIPTFTAPGHTCIYTGSVPNIHGIVGNEWYASSLQKTVYCTEDASVQPVGSAASKNGQMSPRNMFTTTITDELRLATNFKSKVIGIALKDRGAILPAGHAANAAYWYDSQTGKFISSTYYMNELPKWVNNFNERNLPDSFYALNWTLSLPENIYLNYCDSDHVSYERKIFGKNQTGFPYDLSAYIKKNYGILASTPYGNSITTLLAEAAIKAEELGKDSITDFLTVSYSSTDYIGHAFGPNSVEQLDDFIKLDLELGKLFNFLDATVGKNKYTVFLTADHGVAHIPAYTAKHNLPGGNLNIHLKELNQILKNKFGKENMIASLENYQIYLNPKLIESDEIDEEDVETFLIHYLQQQEGISQVISFKELDEAPLNSAIKERIVNGYHPQRSGQLQIIVKPGYMEGDGYGTTHGLWNPYDAHIPLLWYGAGIQKGVSNRTVYMSDIAATVSALLHIQMPNGCIGSAIDEVLKK
jgi:predicted AlkP superfamily pyrophosphatase or phosphodiesterase